MNELTTTSDMFAQACSALGNLNIDENATSFFDGLSGAYGFTDEVPRVKDVQLRLSCYSVLRGLWAYRQSIVVARPLKDLEEWWASALNFAPEWPGFTESRMSASMAILARECDAKAQCLTSELDKLDENEGKK